MSDPYGQQPWANPPQPQQPYGQPAGSVPNPAPAPVGQPYPGGYPQAYPQPYAQPYPTPVAVVSQAKNPILGVIALVIILAATAVSAWQMFDLTQIFGQLVVSASNGGTYAQSQIEDLIRTPVSMLVGLGSLGFAGWILAIVATATNRGRVMGIIGIVLGVIAPIALWLYFFLAVGAMVQHVGG